MKKTIFCTNFLFLLTLSLCGQDTIYFDSNWIKVKKEKAAFFRTIIPYNLKYQVEDYIISGQVQMKGFSLMKDSLIKDGYFEYYSANGIIEMKINYINDIQDGQYELFYNDGKPKEIGFYKNDLLNGKNTQYFQNGKVKREAELLNGKYNGRMIYYNDQGIKIGEGNCIDDGWDGKWIKYYNNGDSVSELFYGNTLLIEDVRIKFTSNEHIWQQMIYEENQEYKRIELKCIAPISNRKKIITDPPTFNVLVSKTNDGFENYNKKFPDKEPLDIVIMDSEIQLIESYQYNFTSRGNTKNELLVFRLRKDDKTFLIEYIGKETDNSNNKKTAVDMIKNIKAY